MQTRRPTRAEQEASEWIVRLDGPDVSLADHNAFRRWLAAKPENQPAYEALARTWDRLDLLKTLENDGGLDLAAEELERRPLASRRALLAGLGVGAAGIAGFAGYAALAPSPALAYETGVGEQQTLTLSDGTSVVLNAASRIEVSVNDDRRLARLVAGEALFDIAPGAGLAFHIETPFGEVRALAAAVVVKILSAGVRATLIEGAAIAQRDSFLGPTQRVELAPATEVVLDRGGVEQRPAEANVITRRVSWRNGLLAFDGETLLEASGDVERQTGVRFVFAEPALAEIPVGGLVQAGDLDAFLLLLRENLAIEAVRGREGVITLSRAE